LKRKPDSLSKLIDDISFILQYIDQIVIPDTKKEGLAWRKVKNTGVPFWDALVTLQLELNKKTDQKIKVKVKVILI
jgi:hypothetical protein